MTEEKPEAGTASDAVASGADEIEAALSEFDTAASQDKPEQKAEEPLKDEIAWLKQERERTQAQRTREALDAAVSEIKGDLEIDSELVEGWLDVQARKDPRLNKAWQNRHNDEAGYKRVLGALSKQLAEKFSASVDREATDTQEAVTAAVRSASNKTQDDKPMTREAWRKLSKEDRAKAQSEHGVQPV